MDFCFSQNMEETLDLGMFCFLILFPYFLHFPYVLETILLMWRLMKIFYFWSHFYTNVNVKLFTKELNLFCSWARPSINIFDHFVIEVWIPLQQCFNWNRNSIGMSIGIFLKYKNRSKWASVEMYLRRFSTAFRTATVKNTHR